MVAYDHDSNAILAEPIKTRSADALLQAMKKIHQYLSERGLHPALQILDNECPAVLKQFFKQENVQYQLVPPNLHRNNAAEKAIGTFKDHFVTIMCSVDPRFPMHLWCRLVRQAVTTLNLLRQSRINPRLSAEAQLNGAFDYNTTPLAPPGTQVVVYENPENRRTWSPHGVDGWYLGSAPEHYRCHTVYVTKTRMERIARTVEFFPHDIDMPTTSSADNAAEAARMLAEALHNPAPASPFQTMGSDQMRALRQLSDLFTAAVPTDEVPAPKEAPVRAAHLPPTPAPPTATPANNHPRTTRPQLHQLPGSTAIFDRRAPQPPRVLIQPLPPVATRTRNIALPVGQQQHLLTDKMGIVECPATPRAAPLVRAPPLSSPRVPMRQQQSPAPAWAPTTNRLPPPRPHPISFPCPNLSAPVAPDRQYPHLIAPDEDDPIRHRYPLRSQGISVSDGVVLMGCD